ncbi:ATP-binding protein [Phenylobacterium sp.]|uniref:ATP-binding protein n=1 Tax=Phenylobacterium sp. TaxID=1871053 RepID=UPI001213BA32|nr:ATP-binding protein [Phenylobacterium sp.]THD58525.1 MAG: response regulator [Phenylobacterium sp.]
MFAVLTCIFAQHDLRLVAAAALICVVAASSAFGFQARGLAVTGGLRWAWLFLTALVAGSGVWGTHFLAMLAYQPALRIGYDLPETFASLAAAIVGMGLGFSLPAWRHGRGGDLIGGTLVGASVVVMHFMGIDAIRTQAHVSWDPRYVAAALLAAAAGGMAAFSLRRATRGRWAWAPPAAALVLGIVGLHFIAMTAITLVPDPRLTMPAEVMDRAGLALATGGLAALILGASAALMLMERLGRRGAFVMVRQALNAVPAGIVFYDPQDRVRDWNAGFAALMAECGIAPQVGRLRADYVQASAAAGWEAEIEAERPHWVEEHSSQRLTGTRDLQLPDGRHLRIEMFRTDDGGGVTVMSDITAEKRSAAAMAAARDAAEAANRAKSDFLANMSHEIRTPLNGVLGIAEVLLRTELSDDQRKLVGVIQQSGGLLNGLLSDLLDLARVEAGKADLRIERARLDELAGVVGDLFATAAQEKGLTLDIQVAPGAEGEVACDPLRLRQVLGNLVSNAVKFTDAGQVTLGVARNGARVRFAVRDTGQGIDPAEKAVIFQRFHQADSSATRRHGGVGLGLSLCDSYVRKMGGELTCESTPGEGSLFAFELELPALAPLSAGEAAVLAHEEDAVSVFDRFNVLVVDDNPVNRQIMELILGSVGIPHASVKDGLEAVEAMTTGDFDAVLMDIQMPVMDGLEATRRIREWERGGGRKRSPILIVSANGLKEHIEAGRAAGADAHLNKPISAQVLLNELEAQRAAVAAQQQAA